MKAALFLLMSVLIASANAQSWGPALETGKAVKAEPVKKLPLKSPPKRRAVRAEPITMPAAPQVRSTVAVPTTVVPAPVVAVPPAPIPLTACDAAGNCRDASGRQLHGGVGNTLLDANGRTCVRQGAFVQCQ
jgi:hypothetical protein